MKASSYKTVSEEELHPYTLAKSIYANHFDIIDKAKLDELERQFSAIRQAELIARLPALDQVTLPDYLYSFKTYTLMHYRLFSDLYPWAGMLRSFDMKYDSHIFTSADKLIFYGEQVFNNFKTKVKCGFQDRSEFIKESANFLNFINTLHPFPDGNGRSQRNIISMHLNYHGFYLNWDRIHKWEIYETLKQSFEGNSEPLEYLFDRSLVEIDLTNTKLK